MSDERTIRPEALSTIAATVPLLSMLVIADRATGEIVARWAAAEAVVPAHPQALARLLPAALATLGDAAHVSPSLVFTTDRQSTVVTEVWEDGLAVFSFREAVSFDWASYYVRRAIGLLNRR
jgi:hypothetical protein